ncbi:sensor domain-containing protein [Heyndrickxia oleronia]|uniref:sensor domain-containing protein n=1 Tax=Heyndrickxia oleronia TaxID=38875 RepID=UPI000B2F5C8C|nr:EAL domain-containing protein [Heyndrickxia oleronia]MBU5214428.1 EAL domain-containing protein [Heyndrickxia oleronia]NYV67342.1 EAL domain-containing protein [Bacillus sp. Gen3]
MDQINSRPITKYMKHPNNQFEEKMIKDIFFTQLSDMIFIMKVDSEKKFRYAFANEKAYEHANLTQEDMGKSLEEVLPEDRASHLYHYYNQVINTGEVIVYSDDIEDQDGQKRSFESRLNGIKDHEGKISYIVSITRDITSTVIEKKQLMESKEIYQSLIVHNLDAILSVNEKGRILNANPASQKLLGWGHEDLVDRSIYDFIDKDGVSKIYGVMEKTLEGEPQEISDCTFFGMSNRKINTQLKTVPIIVHEHVVGIYVIIRDLTEKLQNTEKIHYMAMHDHLTGLWNRKALMEHMQNEIINSKKINRNFAILYMDIDRFKYFNDTLGHQAGDLLLKETADRLLNLKATGFRVYRLGGDEFVVLLAEREKWEVQKFAQSILDLFHVPYNINGQDYYVTPSIGISLFPTDGHDTETLIKNADSALLQVKEKGKGHFRFYRSDMNEAFPNYILMESHLRKAIDMNEFVMHYQPQVHLKTGKIKTFEALLRWQNRKFGNVPPGQFIPLAEETGLIIPIGEWVIHSVCQQLANWREKGHQDIRIAVNISPKQFLQSNLPEVIQQALIENQLPASSLEIEITEGAMEDTRAALSMLQRLKELGVIISVDDFGTGYSSLNYLKSFPIDILKIDQSFVREIQINEKDAAITKTIIHLAHNLGMEVIAEGVEEKDQVQFLVSVECQKAQGYYFSRPVTAEEIEQKVLYA